jgi:hypothetical protein
VRCPLCKLLSPDTALRCDCGYAFNVASAAAPARPGAYATPAAIAGIVGGVFCLGLAEIIKQLDRIEYNGRQSKVSLKDAPVGV